MNRSLRVPGLLLAVLLSALPFPASSQRDGDPIPFGHYRVLTSSVLGEDRVLQIHLPRGYEEADLSYPVVYLFYSDATEGYYALAVHELSHLSLDLIPQAILVGIPNTQRYRDLLAWPQAGRPQTGRADRFLTFVQEELIPFVDSQYRTKPYRILIGPQAAAVFGAYTLLHAPDAFQAFLLNDPCRQDTDERSLCREIVQAAEAPRNRETFFLVEVAQGDDRWSQTPLEELRTELAKEAHESFRWTIDLVPHWRPFLPPLHLGSGFQQLFAGYPFDTEGPPPRLDRIRNHFEGLSRRFGFTLDPTDQILAQSSDRLLESGDHEGALEVLNHLVEFYPFSVDGPWRLANLHRIRGDTARAIEYYEECLRLDPGVTPAREWLERLRGG